MKKKYQPSDRATRRKRRGATFIKGDPSSSRLGFFGPEDDGGETLEGAEEEGAEEEDACPEEGGGEGRKKSNTVLPERMSLVVGRRPSLMSSAALEQAGSLPTEATARISSPSAKKGKKESEKK